MTLPKHRTVSDTSQQSSTVYLQKQYIQMQADMDAHMKNQRESQTGPQIQPTATRGHNTRTLKKWVDDLPELRPAHREQRQSQEEDQTESQKTTLMQPSAQFMIARLFYACLAFATFMLIHYMNPLGRPGALH